MKHLILRRHPPLSLEVQSDDHARLWHASKLCQAGLTDLRVQVELMCNDIYMLTGHVALTRTNQSGTLDPCACIAALRKLINL